MHHGHCGTSCARYLAPTVVVSQVEAVACLCDPEEQPPRDDPCQRRYDPNLVVRVLVVASTLRQHRAVAQRA
eukprot:2160518-Rhodomonas_salina.1